MAEILTAIELKEQFTSPLFVLAAEFRKLDEEWAAAVKEGAIPRSELLLNTKMAIKALGTLRKFRREAAGKLQDAKDGVYRYRNLDRQHTKAKKADKPED